MKTKQSGSCKWKALSPGQLSLRRLLLLDVGVKCEWGRSPVCLSHIKCFLTTKRRDVMGVFLLLCTDFHTHTHRQTHTHRYTHTYLENYKWGDSFEIPQKNIVFQSWLSTKVKGRFSGLAVTSEQELDSLSVSEVGTQPPHSPFSPDWHVTDVNNHLQNV